MGTSRSLSAALTALAICAFAGGAAAAEGEKAKAEDAAAGGGKKVASAQTSAGSSSSSSASAAVVEEDKEKAEEKADAPARVPWRGSSLSWTTEASSQLLGVGKNYQSSDYLSASMSWSAWLNYYIVDQEKDKLTVTAAPGFGVELTNSDDTVTKREVQFQDLPVWFAYSRTLFKKNLFSTNLRAWARFTFPTNPYSYGSGTYLTTSPWLWLMQTLPLGGEKSPVFKTVTIGLITRWDHRFGKATTRVNSGLERPRMGASGEVFLSDQLSFKPLASDSVKESIYLGFNEAIAKMPLSVFARFNFSQSFLPKLNHSCDVMVNYGQTCVDSQSPPDVRHVRYGWGFDANVIFQPLPEAGIWLAYGNDSPNQLADDGTRHWSPFWSPAALFSATLLFYPDALYERLAFGQKRAMAQASSTKKQF
jgi:hypothetical protein